MCMASYVLAKYRTHKWVLFWGIVTMVIGGRTCQQPQTTSQWSYRQHHVILYDSNYIQFIENNVSTTACKKIWLIVLAGPDSLVISEVMYNGIWHIPCCVSMTFAGGHFSDGMRPNCSIISSVALLFIS